MTIYVPSSPVATVTLDQWYDYVMPDLPGITVESSIVLSNIRMAAADYIRLTKSYWLDLNAINVVALKPDYVIDPGANLILVEPVDVKFNGVALTPMGYGELSNLLGSTWESESDTPEYYYMLDEGTIVLAKAPSVSLTAGLVIKAAVAPSDTATTVPAVYYKNPRHRNAITAGALASFYGSPKKPYTDFNLASIKQAEFNAACDVMNTKMSVSRTRGPLRTAVIHGVR